MNNIITIVSGLPRSGTSMMMRMLEAGGMTPLTDHIRKADIDNPLGYYELEKVKKIKEDSSWLENAQGKVFKMVSLLLYELPKDWSYLIVFMKRNVDEMIESQKKMLERQNSGQTKLDMEKMVAIYQKHLREVVPWMEAQKNINVIYVSYNDLIENPKKIIQRLTNFLNRKLDFEKMAAVVDKNLYRNRLLNTERKQ